MVICLRTKISLAQLLDLFEYELSNILFEKHSLENDCSNLDDIRNILENENLTSLIEEIVLTQNSLRSNISPRYTFDERWDDLKKCLLLDGYRITEDKSIVAIEPTVNGVIALEDDLTTELKKSSLSKKDKIVKLLLESSDAFKKASSDYNGCLSKARLTLETIVRNKIEDESGIDEKWGTALGILKDKDFLTKKEEEAIASTYTFVSDGSHKPLGFTDEEYARYGRNLLMTTCYYLIKKQNAMSKTISKNSFLNSSRNKI